MAGNFVQTGLTGEGSAAIDGGAFHEIVEIDVAVTSPGRYVNALSTVQPRHMYQVGWVGLSVAAPIPGTSSPLYQWRTALVVVDAEFRIFTEPAANATEFPWGADTVVWSFRDSVCTVNVWWA